MCRNTNTMYPMIYRAISFDGLQCHCTSPMVIMCIIAIYVATYVATE